MKSRIFNTLSLVSAIFLGFTIFLAVWSVWADPRKDCVSFSGDFHVAVQSGRVSLFNDKEYGPYYGSIIALTSPEWPIERIFAERRGFGDTAGIYYRYFRWADSGNVLWTLSVSLLYPLVVFIVLPGAWLWRRWRARRTLPACHKESGSQ